MSVETSQPGAGRSGEKMEQAPTTAQLLEIAKAAAEAGAAVLAERRPGPLHRASLGIQAKSSRSDLVTDYDRRAEEAVRKVITALRPRDEISGEEYGTTSPENPSGYRWSIDPLDGTANFVRGVLYYATSVAVVSEAGDWLAGAVVAPALGTSWWASRRGGAYRKDGQQPPQQLEGPASDAAQGRILATGFGYDAQRRSKQLEEFEGIFPGFDDVRRIGSAALDLCMVAEGTLDAYYERGIQEHDWAAGALIAEEAGVLVERPLGAHSHNGTYADLPLITAGIKAPTEANTQITVRRIRQEDYEAVADLTQRSYLAAGHFTDPQHEYMLKIADVAKRAEEAQVLVAEREGRILGSVTLAMEGDLWADIARKGELEFRLLVVDPDAQRSGVGRALLEAVVDEAQVNPEVHEVVLTTGRDWKAARSMYHRMGFVGRPERDWNVPGTDITLLVYGLNVRPGEE